MCVAGPWLRQTRRRGGFSGKACARRAPRGRHRPREGLLLRALRLAVAVDGRPDRVPHDAVRRGLGRRDLPCRGPWCSGLLRRRRHQRRRCEDQGAGRSSGRSAAGSRHGVVRHGERHRGQQDRSLADRRFRAESGGLVRQRAGGADRPRRRLTAVLTYSRGWIRASDAKGTDMPFYQRRGELPRKRHIVFRENGRLLTEEVMGLEGFTGNESILYHLESPCRVKELGTFTPVERDEWVPETHAHRLQNTYDVPPAGDEISGRRSLMWNDDVEISLCRPEGTMDYFFRNGEGDEVVFVHEGKGTLETTFGDVPYEDGDYVVIPRGTTYRFMPEGAQRYLVFETPGLIEIPRRYRNQYGQILEGAPYYHRDIHPPTDLHTRRERGEFLVKVRVRGGFQDYILDYHPFDVVGWDGYLYPWKFSVHDFEPITGRIHQPPPSHQTFQGRNFVICSFCPRKLDFDELAVPIPYHHSNLQSEEMIYYVSGNFGARKGVSVGSITLHPSGLPHGPQPGLAEKSIGVRETHELAVMCDTFHPLKLTTFARDLDDGKYAYSWYENAVEGATPDALGDATGAGLTSHL